MSYQEDKLTTIANAIRGLKGTTGTIKASDFASEINAYKMSVNNALPVGTEIMHASIPGNPQSILGGTWERVQYKPSSGIYIYFWKRTA